jgi:DNA-binding NarL/FixJ family response regulator
MTGPTLKQELNAREYELVGLLALGYRFEQIGFVVGIQIDGVRKAFARMYEKTGTADKLELACRFAWERKR